MAGEVIELATRSQSAATNTRSVVTKMNDSTREDIESLAAFSSINLDQVLETKQRISEIAHGIKDSNDHPCEGVSSATGVAQRHANNVTEMIMSMQIQDITKQRLHRTLRMLQQIQEKIEVQECAVTRTASD